MPWCSVWLWDMFSTEYRAWIWMRFCCHKPGSPPVNVMISCVDGAPTIRRALENRKGFPAQWILCRFTEGLKHLEKWWKEPTSPCLAHGQHDKDTVWTIVLDFLVLNVLVSLLQLGFLCHESLEKLRSIKAIDLIVVLFRWAIRGQWQFCKTQGL